MDQLDNLRTIAEVGTAFAGFTGVVIVLGHRSTGTWSAPENSTIRVLLESSIGAVFLALVPAIVLAGSTSPDTTWRVSAGLLTVYHVLAIVRADVLDRREAAHLIGARLDRGLTVVGVLSVCASAAVAFGFAPQYAAPIYTLCLLWMLFVAALAFCALLLSGVQPPKP